MPPDDVDRNLLFGLLALQNGLIDQDQLLDAFRRWIRDKGRPIADDLVELGSLDAERRDVIDRLVDLHLARSDGRVERGLASILASRFALESLAGIADSELDASLVRLGLGSTLDHDDDETDVPAAATTSDRQRFRRLRFHARGNLGAVYLALDTELNRQVALKEILGDRADDRASRRRFRLEAKVTGRLEHPGIVPVYGLGRDEDGRLYYAMRFIEGDSLEQAIERSRADAASMKDPGRRALGLRQLLRRLTDVCNAVEFAHSRDVLHRDIKPANIILGPYGETLLVDWGLAKPLGRVECGTDTVEEAPGPPPTLPCAGTLPGYVLGTPAYMSPEQAQGRLDRLGPRSDVYSLGATLYSILTGKPPFQGTDLKAALARVSAGDFSRPRQVDPAVPAAPEAICLKAMAVDPAGRYDSARALAEDIERWLADEPVLAYPEPLPARIGRWVRRRKQWVAATAAVLALAAVGLAIHDGQLAREKTRTADQLTMTRDALRDLLKVSGEKLTVVANTEGLREDLARLVLDRYQQLRDRFPTDPGVRLETAQVFRVIGSLGRITGQFARARESDDEAIGLLTALCEEDPGHPEYRRVLADALVDRGEFHHMNGRTIDAENDLRAAIDHADKVVSAPGRRAKASALLDLSEILTLKGQTDEALAAAGRAVDLLRPLVAAADPGCVAQDRWLLSLALTARGAAAAEADDPDRAARDLAEASRIAASVAPGDEVYDDAQFQLATIANRRGELSSREASSRAESEGYYEAASGILGRLIQDHGQVPHYREELTVTCCGRAAVRLDAGRITEARRDCEAAGEHLDGLIRERARQGAPEYPEYLSLLGRVLALRSRIESLSGRTDGGRQTREAAVDALRRAVQLDPARAADRARLEQLTRDPAR